MKIIASQLGKRYNRDWIFKNLNFEFRTGQTYAVVGPNGSGKSTLLQVLWGQLPPSEGKIEYTTDTGPVASGEFFRQISIAAPYMELVEEFSLEEIIRFHFRFKQPWAGMGISEMVDTMQLTAVRNRLISQFSSGMKQRVKLALAFFSETSCLFLDEPGTNLDQSAFAWYLGMLEKVRPGRLVIIASNQAEELPLNAVRLNLPDFKPVTPAR